MDTAADGTSTGERLLRSPHVAQAAAAVEADVRQQLAAALHGPIGTALAATSGSAGLAGPGTEGGGGGAHALLGAAIPRAFIATGAALTTGYMGLAAGDDTRVAGALLCAQRLLFPGDPLGNAAVRAAAQPALDSLPDRSEEPAAADDAEAAAGMQRRVAADVEAIERAFLAVVPHVSAAALSSFSWKHATGGAGPASGALTSHLGPFLDGLVRWAFYVEVALEGIRHDDWARAGASLIAARRVTATQ